jgi:hypothetical protein
MNKGRTGRGRAGRLALVVALVGTWTTLGPAPTADAAARCHDLPLRVGVTVDDDLVVRPGAECFLFDVAVRGTVYVSAGGILDLTRSGVVGDLVVEGDGRAVLNGSVVLGGVRLEGAGAARLSTWDSVVRRSVRGTAASVAMTASQVDGATTVTTSEEFRLGRSHVQGWVTLRAREVFFESATTGTGMTMSGAVRTRLCGATIAGLLSVSRITGPWHSGTSDACPGIDAGAVTLVDNPSSVYLERSHVRGSLHCNRNTGPNGVRLTGTVVDGVRSGQCA